jgi:aconitate hydratase
VIAESFERIHRSNLIGMGVLPLRFSDGAGRQTLHLDGSEIFEIEGLAGSLRPRSELTLRIHRNDGIIQSVPLIAGLETADELEYFRNGGILQYVLRSRGARH